MSYSLTGRRAAVEAIRKHARAGLALAASANAGKPTLSLFKQPAPAIDPEPAPPCEATAPPEPPPDKGAERYAWRCKLVHKFGRSYLPDRDRMKEARDFAYSRRASIHAAFDRGELKAAVLESLAKAFEQSREPADGDTRRHTAITQGVPADA
jgi:hypothetical protein